MLIWATAVALASPPAARQLGHPAVGGCPSTVAELPDSPLYERTDPRLTGEALIVVLKDKRRVVLFSKGARVKTAEGDACWWAGLASGYVEGHKQVRGDLRTPEGWQRTSDRPWSQFYSALTVHYPSTQDAQRALAAGTISQAQHDEIVGAHRKGHVPTHKTPLGGLIAIHGGGGSSDWTLGCVAMDNTAIDLMRAHLPAGMRTDILILP